MVCNGCASAGVLDDPVESNKTPESPINPSGGLVDGVVSSPATDVRYYSILRKHGEGI